MLLQIAPCTVGCFAPFEDPGYAPAMNLLFAIGLINPGLKNSRSDLKNYDHPFAHVKDATQNNFLNLK
jgi:hypothetical protein